MSSNLKFPKAAICKIVDEALSTKLRRYKPESKTKPFAEAVLTKEKVVTHSMVHSMLTTFGMSFYEQITKALARPPIVQVEHQHKLLGNLPDDVYTAITKIMRELRTKGSGRTPCKDTETAEIRSLFSERLHPLEYPDNTVDIRLVMEDGTEYLIDIGTVKPNLKEVVALKEKMLRWTALRLSQNAKANVIAAIAIPYNPFEPEPYRRWTFDGICELGKDVLIAEEFWNLVGQREDTYALLMETLHSVGAKWKPVIDDFITRLADEAKANESI